MYSNDGATARTRRRSRSTGVWVDLGPGGTPVSQARRFVEAHVPSTMPGTIVDDVRLVTSELVTNAVAYAGGVARLWVIVDDRFVHIEVDDSSFELPHIVEPGAGGRGLRLVEMLSSNWGARTNQFGKTVFADFALSVR